jgi:hypothetical protein
VGKATQWDEEDINKKHNGAVVERKFFAARALSLCKRFVFCNDVFRGRV